MVLAYQFGQNVVWEALILWCKIEHFQIELFQKCHTIQNIQNFCAAYIFSHGHLIQNFFTGSWQDFIIEFTKIKFQQKSRTGTIYQFPESQKFQNM